MSFEFWAQTVCRQNTGTHILDSGGAYGRHWERPAEVESEPGLRIERVGEYFPIDAIPADQLARLRADDPMERDISGVPSIFVPGDWDAKPGDFVGIEARVSTPHFLDAMLTPDRDLQREFDLFDGEQLSSARYEDILKAFCEERGIDMKSGGYTYNDENDFTQDFVYAMCEDEDDDIIVIRSHNGCDARGGFSSPFFARWANRHAADYFWHWGIAFNDEDGNDCWAYEVFGIVGEDGELEFRSRKEPDVVVHPYHPVEGY